MSIHPKNNCLSRFYLGNMREVTQQIFPLAHVFEVNIKIWKILLVSKECPTHSHLIKKDRPKASQFQDFLIQQNKKKRTNRDPTIIE